MVMHLNHLVIGMIFPHIIILAFLLELAIEVSEGVDRGCGHVNSAWPSAKYI